MSSRNLTFSQVQTRMAERAGSPGMPSQKTLPNANAALGSFLKSLDLSWTTEVGLTLRDDFTALLSAHLEDLRASGKSSGYIRNRGWLLRFWNHLVSVLDHESAIEASALAPITVALRGLFADGSRRRTPTAKAAKIHPDALKNWIGGSIPGRDQVAALSRLEDLCNLMPGSLTSLLPDRMPSRRSMKAARPPSTNESRVRNKRLSQDKYRLPINEMAKSPILKDQWVAIMRDKTQAAPRAKGSAVWTTTMVNQLFDTPKKALEGPWRLRPLMDGETPRWHDCVDGHWVPSARKKLNQLRSFFGWAMKSIAEGGAGLRLDQLTFALITDHEMVRRFSAWRVERNGFPTTTDTGFLQTMKALLTPYAYLRRTPAFGATVGITEALAWEKHCANAHAVLLSLQSSLKPVVVMDSRDPKEPLKGVLELESPMGALIRGVRRLEHNKAAYPGKHEKYWARDLVLLAMPSSNPLRIENLSRMTYRADNTGNVRRTPDGGWRIFIDKSDMKNINGAAKDRDYDQPIDPNVWQYLEQYLTTYRSQFAQSDYLFAPAATRSKRLYMRSQKLSEQFSELLKQHVPECPEGSGEHSVRHIVATHIIVTTGDYVLAAHLLHDYEKTVQETYAHLLKQYFERKRTSTMTPMLTGLSSKAA